LEGVVVDTEEADMATQTDVASLRRALAAHGRSWLRWLNRDYRNAQAELQGMLVNPPPKALSERLSVLDAFIICQRARKTIETDDSLGRQAFGTLWRGERSDWDMLSRAEVIDVASLSGKTVKFGATVTIVDEDTDAKVKYQIVGDSESDAKNGKISISSPISRALIGKSVGDTVEVAAPGGARSYEILKVQFI
ncbi:MAG: transcription elongation factor GreA, partial [Micropepsaceae bacterium]